MCPRVYAMLLTACLHFGSVACMHLNIMQEIKAACLTPMMHIARCTLHTARSTLYATCHKYIFYETPEG
jgi:hypothetical protein